MAFDLITRTSWIQISGPFVVFWISVHGNVREKEAGGASAEAYYANAPATRNKKPFCNICSPSYFYSSFPFLGKSFGLDLCTTDQFPSSNLSTIQVRKVPLWIFPCCLPKQDRVCYLAQLLFITASQALNMYLYENFGFHIFIPLGSNTINTKK